MDKRIEKYFRLLQERPEEFIGSLQGEIVKDSALMEKIMMQENRALGVVYDSPYHLMVVDLLRTPDDRSQFYERVMNTVQNPSVVIIPIYHESFILLHQYRHAMQAMQYAFPRGFGEIGLSAEENTCKELQEELGCEVGKVECLNSIVADSGLCGHAVSVCVAELNDFEKQKDYEGIVDTIVLNKTEMMEWIEKGKINDAFTISAFCMWCLTKRH